MLSGADVQALLSLPECIEAVEAAFADPAARSGVMGFDGFHIKAAKAGGFFATKINGNFAHTTPRIQGVLVLSSDSSGAPLAIMDSSAITAIRTAAATGVAARHLARRDARTVTIIGCGEQAAWQLAAVRAVRPIEQVYAFDLDPARAARFGPSIHAPSDIVITCTPSTMPILFDVAPGTFVAAVGADAEHKSEIAPDLLRRVVVIPDLAVQARAIGDLHHAPDVTPRAELGDVIRGTPGRDNDDEIIIFDSTGTALQDVAAAALVYRRALARRYSKSLELSYGGLA